MSRRIRVLTVVTRFQAGAGAVALRGAQGLDPDRFEVRFLVGRGDRLIEEAARAGFDIRVEPTLRSSIAPRDETRALRRISDLLRREHVDVVHTHSAKAGALGRVAARSIGVPTIVHTLHGFPFHDFQGHASHAAYVAIERRLSRITDAILAVGTGVAVEALRRGLASPEQLHTIGPAVEPPSVWLCPQTRARARDLLDLPADALVVGTVGRLDYQ
jgi:hypothetical protein